MPSAPSGRAPRLPPVLKSPNLPGRSTILGGTVFLTCSASGSFGSVEYFYLTGILEVDSAQLNVVFGTSRDTSDFVADSLELWWTNRKSAYPGVRRLLINLDNGPEIGSSRTQFMKRLVDFSDRHQLTRDFVGKPKFEGAGDFSWSLAVHAGESVTSWAS